MPSIKSPNHNLNETSVSPESTNPEPLADLDNVSKRLKYIIDTLGVKQSHMAEKLGLSPSGLHYILNNDVRFSKNAKKIAEYLNVNEEWLATGEGHIYYEENKPLRTYKIPLYYPDQLRLYFRSNKRNSINTNDYMVTTIPYLNKTIGIYLTATDFSPKFEVGDMVVFEQTENFKDGEILLIYLSKSNDIILRYAFHIENSVVLISSSQPSIRLSPENGDIIIGAYRECLKRTHLI